MASIAACNYSFNLNACPRLARESSLLDSCQLSHSFFPTFSPPYSLHTPSRSTVTEFFFLKCQLSIFRKVWPEPRRCTFVILSQHKPLCTNRHCLSPLPLSASLSLSLSTFTCLISQRPFSHTQSLAKKKTVLRRCFPSYPSSSSFPHMNAQGLASYLLSARSHPDSAKHNSRRQQLPPQLYFQDKAKPESRTLLPRSNSSFWRFTCKTSLGLGPVS